MVEKSKYYVKEIVRPIYLTGKVEKEKFSPPKEKVKIKKSEKKKSKSIFEGKLLRKPKKELVKEISSIKVLKQLARETSPQLVREGRTGHFQEEYEKEKRSLWLGGYSL